MRDSSMFLAIITFSVLALIAIGVGAQSVQPTSETYSWSGELVGFDANGRTMTIKSRVVGDQALAELPQFKSGDRIVLTWSGFDTYADAISRAVRYDAAKKWNEPFTFPVEFVAYESPRQYVTFKFQVPAGNVEPLKSVKTWRVGHGDIQASSIDRDRGHHSGERVHGFIVTSEHELNSTTAHIPKAFLHLALTGQRHSLAGLPPTQVRLQVTAEEPQTWDEGRHQLARLEDADDGAL